MSHDACPHGSSCTLHTCDIPLSRTLASSNCITLPGSVREEPLRTGMVRPPADVRQQNVRCAHARSSKAFETETCTEQQHALAVHPVGLIHKQLRQSEGWVGGVTRRWRARGIYLSTEKSVTCGPHFVADVSNFPPVVTKVHGRRYLRAAVSGARGNGGCRKARMRSKQVCGFDINMRAKCGATHLRDIEAQRASRSLLRPRRELKDSGLLLHALLGRAVGGGGGEAMCVLCCSGSSS